MSATRSGGTPWPRTMRNPSSSKARSTSAATRRLSPGAPARNGAMSMMGTAPSVMTVASSVLGEAEDALAQNVAQDLRGAGADAAPAGEKGVELPLPVVGREGARLGDLRVRADRLARHVGQLLVDLAPEELGGRA